eukprot:SAG31_NODE_212_length_20157_cov_9.648868_12_plen_91_part_00
MSPTSQTLAFEAKAKCLLAPFSQQVWARFAWLHAGFCRAIVPCAANTLLRYAAGKVPDGLDAECAMPGSHAGNHECDCGPHAAFNETYML